MYKIRIFNETRDTKGLDDFDEETGENNKWDIFQELTAAFETEINEFIADKKVIDIRYMPTKDLFEALVIYEE